MESVFNDAREAPRFELPSVRKITEETQLISLYN